jgi:hypothetical protein
MPDLRDRPAIALAPPALVDGLFDHGAFRKLGGPLLVQIGRSDILPPRCHDWRDRAQAWREARGRRTLLVTRRADHWLGGLTGGAAGAGDGTALRDVVAATACLLGFGAAAVSSRSHILARPPRRFPDASRTEKRCP